MGQTRSDLAIGWAQFQLRGGGKRIVSTGGLLAAAVIVGVMLTSWSDPTSLSRSMMPWTIGLLFASAGLMAFGGATGISSAIRKDIDSGLLESHRLMPLAPHWAVIGYILGSVAQFTALGGVAFLLGTYTASLAGIPPQRWLLAGGFIVLLSLFLWMSIAFFAFATRLPVLVGLIFLPTLIPIASMTIPGLALMFRPIRLVLGFLGRPGRATFDALDLGMLVLLAALAIILFTGACRRYRSADAQMLGPALSLAVFGLWVIANVIALGAYDLLHLNWMEGDAMDPDAALIATFILSMVLALIPIRTSAVALLRWDLRHHLEDPALPPRPLGPIAACVLCATVTTVIALAYGDFTPLAGLRTWIILVLALLPMVCLCRWVRDGGTRLLAYLLLWVVIVWCAPIVADAMPQIASNRNPVLGTLGSLSPVGALVVIWKGRELSLIPAVAILALLAGIAVMLTHWRLSRYWQSLRDGRSP